jgi:hypothetical protein
MRGDSTVEDKHDLRVSVSTIPFVPPLLIYVLTFLLSWRHIKHEYLHHNHKPRIDYLAWVLNVKLGPTYIQHLDLRITNLVRSRGLAAWRQSFHSEWRRCQSAKITLPLNPRDNPLPYKWVCTCPAFAADGLFASISYNWWTESQRNFLRRSTVSAVVRSGVIPPFVLAILLVTATYLNLCHHQPRFQTLLVLRWIEYRQGSGWRR